VPKAILDPQSKAEKWEGRFQHAQTAQEPRFKKFEAYYNFLYAVIDTTPAPWRSKVFLPVLAKQVWALAAKFLSLEPGWQARIVEAYEDLSDEDKADLIERIQAKLAWDYNNLETDESVRDKLFEPLIDTIVTGTGMGEPSWCTKVKRRHRRTQFTENKGYADLTTEEVTKQHVSYNDFDGISIFNVYTSTESPANLYKAPWIIITLRKPLNDLKAVNDSQGIAIYQNLDKVRETQFKDAPSFSHGRARDRLVNQNEEFDESVEMCNLYKCYEMNGDKVVICTYAESDAAEADDGWILIREQVDEYWHGRYPLIKFHLKQRPFSFWGEGIFEVTQTLQAAYNDVFNHYMDSLNKSDGMLLTHEDSDVEEFVIEPAGVVTWSGETKPEPIKFPEPDPNQLSLVLNLLDQAISGVTISPYASGIPADAADKTQGTAKGIMRLQEAAGDVVSFFKDNFSKSILMLGRMYLSNNQQYLDAPTSFPMNNAYKDLKPQELQAEFMLTLDPASMDPATQEEQQNKWVMFNDRFLTTIAAANAQADKYNTTPILINFDKYLKQFAEKFNYRNIDKVLMSPGEAKAAQAEIIQKMMQHIIDSNNQQQAAQQAAATKQQATEKPPSESINYKDAPEDIKRQMEAAAGMEPSAGISPSGTDQAAKHLDSMTKIFTAPSGPPESQNINQPGNTQ
jgi:hypothetical protein